MNKLNKKMLGQGLFFIGTLFLSTSAVITGDMGFRYKDGKCINEQGQAGLNKGYFGQCSDLRGVILGRFNLDDIDFSGTQFMGSDLQLSSLNKTILIDVNFEGANLSGVEFANAKIQNANFKKSILKNVVFNEASIVQADFSQADLSKGLLSYFNCESCNFTNTKFIETTLDSASIASSKLSGADFTGANLEEANLSKVHGEKVIFNSTILVKANLSLASITSSSLKRAQLKGADLTGSNFESSDVRGADLSKINFADANFSKVIFNQKTILPISKDKAQELGMIFKKGAEILVLWDQKLEPLVSLTKALEKEGATITFYKDTSNSFDGVGLSNFSTVIYFNGMNYGIDMNVSGQKALVKFVKAGGTFITSEWTSYAFDSERFLQEMPDLVLFLFTTSNSGTFSLIPLPEKKSHPMLDGVTTDIPLEAGHSIGGLRQFGSEQSETIMKDQAGNDAVAVRRFGSGTVVGFYFTCAFLNDTCLGTAGIQRLYINAVNFGL